MKELKSYFTMTWIQRAGEGNWAAFRITPVLMAVAFADSRFGVLNREWIPFVIRFAATLLVLDLLNYALHRSVSFGAISMARSRSSPLRSRL
jgi:hypothetical protein